VRKLKVELSKVLRQMKIRLGRVDRSPGEPMGMGTLVGAFMEVSPPDDIWGWTGYRAVSVQHRKGNAISHTPGYRRGQLWVDNSRQGMKNGDVFPFN